MMAAETTIDLQYVPVFTSLADVYADNVQEAQSRYTRLRDSFISTYGAAPDLYARAPGRVNLIGEHIDYEGYGVLPMAIIQDTVVAVKVAGDSLHISNLDPAKYPSEEKPIDPSQEVDPSKHSWTSYFISAYKGVYDYLSASDMPVPSPVGLQVMVHGLVPTGAGVSSSSAFVCSAALAVLGAHGITLPKATVADFCAKAERYVGVTSGGMDQAISIMGQPGMAKLVEFNPVRASNVVIPDGAAFVVANSLTVSNKAEGAPFRYNLRVVECRLASALLALALGKSAEEACGVLTLREVEGLLGEGADLMAAVKAHLHDGVYTHEEVEGVLGVPLSWLFAGSPAALRSVEAARKVGGFKLRARALHVFGEAKRVTEFKAVTERGGSKGEQLSALGVLMDNSHSSCAALYECSCRELDQLVATAHAAGAIGARLTGAGWGGCAVALVREEDVADFKAALAQQYFARKIEEGLVAPDGLHEVLFASKPASGAALLRLSDL